MMNSTQGIVGKHRHIEGIKKQALEIGRNRLLLTGMVFGVAFAGIACRLVDLTVLSRVSEPRSTNFSVTEHSATGRSNILDRNGMILAVSLPTVSLSADPAKIIDIQADKKSIIIS